MRHQVRFVIIAVVAAVTVSACSRNQPEPPAPPPPPPPSTPTTTPTNPPTPPPPPPEDPMIAVRATLGERVHFDYDMSTIRADAEAVLQRKIPLLRQYASITIRVEGHADERGSIEYNLALGQRRAQAVKDYLVRFGIAANRVAVESYGEERPLVQGSNENAWAQNRRAEFIITGGGN